VPPQLAVVVFAVGTLGLFLLDRDRDPRTSPALWLSVVWLALGSSRNISQWFSGSLLTNSPNDYIDGSPLDRAIYTALILAGLVVLIARGQRSENVLRRNAPLLVFFLYCAASALWSDFPFVALKRWTKALGNVVMVLVVLTDPDATAALKKFLTRTAFLLIPSSVLLIKYYPALGRHYDRWEGTAYYVGVSGDKNMLGGMCLIMGLGLVWRFIDTLGETGPLGRRHRLAIGMALAMNLWLFQLANSATSLGCFMLGATLIVILSLFRRARPAIVHRIVSGIAVAACVVYLFPDVFAYLVGSMGRNTTLTGRTDLWNDLLQMDTHPLLGAGFESFFLGDRLEFLWSKYWWHPNEAHNGFLETYLTLGSLGLCLLALLTATGYRNALNAYRSDPSSGSLRVAFLVIASIYNITEAAFKVMHPVWILFLFAATAVPQSQLQAHRQKESARAGDAEGEESEQFFSGSRLPSPAPWARTSVDQRPHVASGADRLRTPPGELDAEDA
jgi:O-antigen ligase